MRLAALSGSTILGFVLCAAAAQPLFAQQGKPPPASKDDLRAIPTTDRTFMEKAAQVGYVEVQAGALASTKASSNEVRKLAQEIVTEHGKAGKELENIAAAKGIKLPASPPKAQEDALKELENLSGSEFDRRYLVEASIKNRELSQRIFQDAQKNTLDPELKTFIDRTLPTITRHLETARKLASLSPGERKPAR